MQLAYMTTYMTRLISRFNGEFIPSPPLPPLPSFPRSPFIHPSIHSQAPLTDTHTRCGTPPRTFF